jgi:dipeptide transport system ATP-binding protein
MMDLVRENSIITCDHMSLEGQDLLNMSKRARARLISQSISIIFQEPQTSLNPYFTIKFQLDETLKAHGYRRAKERNERMRQLLQDVGISKTKLVLDCYPHQLSPGLLQRIMIASAIACDPLLLIADEPTTALDIGDQHQILDLLTSLIEQRNMSLIIISHDFKMLSEKTDKLTIMYCGQIVESGPTAEVLNSPRHPYTEALLQSAPSSWNLTPKTAVPVLKGSTPSLHHLPVGCYLGPRCPNAQAHCVNRPKLDRSTNHFVRCHFPLNQANEEATDD